MEEGTRFDPSKLSKVIAHGWGGGLHLGTLQLMMVVVIIEGDDGDGNHGLMMMVMELDQMST